MSTRSGFRGVPAGAATALLATLALCGAGTATATAAGCSNEQLRIENNSTALPDCRAYEQVTPTYKDGVGEGAAQHEFSIGAKVEAYTADGDAMAFTNQGNMANNGQDKIFNPYVAKRTSGGWTTLASAPSEAEYFGVESAEGVFARTPDFETDLFFARLPSDPSDTKKFYLRNLDGTVTEVGPAAPLANFTAPPDTLSSGPAEWISGPAFEAASQDLRHVAFVVRGEGVNFSAAALAGETSQELLEYVGTGGEPRVVSVNNEGKELDSCGASWGEGGHAAFFSQNGNSIVFAQVACEGRPSAVYARVNGETTVELSSSDCTRTSGDLGGVCNAPANAGFAGISPDDSVTYFTTAQQLLNSDIDQGQDLYACLLPPGTITPQQSVNPCPTLEPISVTGTAAGANVEQVLDVSKDGSHVVFTASGVLTGTSTNGDGQHAVEGARNMYMYDRDAPVGERLKFVAALCSGSVTSGTVADALCPQSPGAYDSPIVQTAANNRYMIFETFARLDTGDTDEGKDIYRYDTGSGSLVRMSIGRDGYDDNGNATNEEAFLGAFEGVDEPRLAISENGEEVFFTTAEALVPQDTNNARDVYEWDAGQIYLISDGVAPLGSKLQGSSASGDDVLFVTAAPLTPSDGDTVEDIYDARVDGGFPAHATAASCVGETCQGSLPTATPSPAPGTLTVTGDRNLTAGVSDAAAPHLSVTARKVAHRPSGTLTIRVSDTGRLVISGRGLRAASVHVTKPGAVIVTIHLTSQAVAKLTKSHIVGTKVTVRFTAADGQTTTATVPISFRDSANSKSASKARKGHS
jgi:hypothetical protein